MYNIDFQKPYIELACWCPKKNTKNVPHYTKTILNEEANLTDPKDSTNIAETNRTRPGPRSSVSPAAAADRNLARRFTVGIPKEQTNLGVSTYASIELMLFRGWFIFYGTLMVVSYHQITWATQWMIWVFADTTKMSTTFFGQTGYIVFPKWTGEPLFLFFSNSWLVENAAMYATNCHRAVVHKNPKLWSPTSQRSMWRPWPISWQVFHSQGVLFLVCFLVRCQRFLDFLVFRPEDLLIWTWYIQ